jgi:hypothetical protein
MTFEETVEDERYRVVVKCGDSVLIDRVIIKCKSETADQIRNFVYSGVADALYQKGLPYIEGKCGKKTGSMKKAVL